MFPEAELREQQAIVEQHAVCEEARRCRKAKRLVKAFENACEELAFVGSYPLEHTAAVKAEYKRTRANLLAFMGV